MGPPLNLELPSPPRKLLSPDLESQLRRPPSQLRRQPSLDLDLRVPRPLKNLPRKPRPPKNQPRKLPRNQPRKPPKNLPRKLPRKPPKELPRKPPKEDRPENLESE